MGNSAKNWYRESLEVWQAHLRMILVRVPLPSSTHRQLLNDAFKLACIPAFRLPSYIKTTHIKMTGQYYLDIGMTTRLLPVDCDLEFKFHHPKKKKNVSIKVKEHLSL